MSRYNRHHKRHRRRRYYKPRRHKIINFDFSNPLTIIIIILLLIGIFGGYRTATAYHDCDLGFEGKFCLLWHQTGIGEMKEFFDGLDQEFGFG